MDAQQPLNALDHLEQYPLLQAILGRRSRRFGRGMSIGAGPLAYTSHYSPEPLTELEEALVVFAACGITGFALADLDYGPGQGGNMLAGVMGRTIASPDAVDAVSLIVTNDTATYLIKRPQDFSPVEIPALVQLAHDREFVELYRRLRVKIAAGRCAPPVKPGYNFNINNWALYAAGSTYFLPVAATTEAYLNVLLEVFNPAMGLYGIDERNHFQPAGIGSFAKSRGGSLDDNPGNGRVFTIEAIEQTLIESIGIEQGMLHQNLALMVQALGLGGYPNFARHEYGWFQALGFRLGSLPSTQYVGAGRLITFIMNLLGRNQPYPYPLGLERDGQVLLKPFSPPYYSSMKEAVEAFVTYKFGARGLGLNLPRTTDWKDPDAVTHGILPVSAEAVAATIAYCEYIYDRYGRFPAYTAPYRTMLGYQATHVDVEFYERFYTPDALTETQRLHHEQWHGAGQ